MEWLKLNHPGTFAGQYGGNDSGTDAVTLQNSFCDAPVVSPIATAELTADEAEKTEGKTVNKEDIWWPI